MAFSLLCGYTVASAQIMLSPVFYSTIDGLNKDNSSILEGRLQSLISSMDMVAVMVDVLCLHAKLLLCSVKLQEQS